MQKKRYPNINLSRKEDIAKRISGKKLPYIKARALVDDVLRNFDKYWYDSDASKPEDGKFVRSAVGTPLVKLLELVDAKILAPYDKMVPSFIFGGLSGKNHIQAAYHLLGEQKGRTLLKMDVRRFFEQIRERRVFYLFYSKCGCSKEAAQILARLCCVPLGPKGNSNPDHTIARGFATSPRLALWCNLDLFQRLEWKMRRKLRGHDPRIAIFVDDIGITASRIGEGKMEEFRAFAEKLLSDFDANQPVPTNPAKTDIIDFANGAQHLGLKLGRNKLSAGSKTRARRDSVRHALAQPLNKEERRYFVQKRRAYHVYDKLIKRRGQPAEK
ncbi:MAG TPA: hypothetical protein VG753_01180 [Candidatus Paceibacterota bacterium]|nr:hypothetical protein [Candidatus Paceibacterota bacterium]